MNDGLKPLTMLLLFFTICACGGGSGSSDSNSQTTPQPERESEDNREARREREREQLRENGNKLVPTENITIVQNEGSVTAQIEGYLPDACHGPAQNNLDTVGNSFYVDVYSKIEGEFCAEVIEEYTLTVDLGDLAPGEYEVVVQEFTRWEVSETFIVD
ncbi:MAG: hypothetical protein CME64_12890 [Halobacteriovoraceae bacterium]|nr:hypothetical protein [Halobacteriovoraceae bacterium]|tara:strand:+ start:116188 stop:116664 length:477 start_codon:yes stop_codon:yes gene_type:complete